jgi:hypothetical protein
MDDSSGEENDEDTSSVVSQERNLDPSDAHIPNDKYVGCHDHNLHNKLATTSVRDDHPAARGPDDTVDTHMRDTRPKLGQLGASPKCWLCTFSPHPTAVAMHSFIINSVSSMDFEFIASQIKHEILAAYPHALVRGFRGFTV